MKLKTALKTLIIKYKFTKMQDKLLEMKNNLSLIGGKQDVNRTRQN